MIAARRLKACATAGLLVTVSALSAGAVLAPSALGASTSESVWVTSLSRVTGSTDGGDRVTVHGSGFAHVRSVRFGTRTGQALKVLSPDTLHITSPAHDRGVVPVQVTTTAGTSARTDADRFTYVAPPRVTGVAPKIGSTLGGTRVTVTGSSFVRVRTVLFGSERGSSLHVLSPTRLQVTSPRNATGNVHIRVVTSYGTAAEVTEALFRFAVAPRTPTAVEMSPGPAGSTSGICAGQPGWVPGTDQLTLAAHVSDPDPQHWVQGRFSLWDLGGSGDPPAVYVIRASEPSGWSLRLPGPGQAMVRVPGSKLKNGHEYGFDVRTNNGTLDGPRTATCYFYYDSTAPSAPADPDAPTTGTVDVPITFMVSSADVIPTGARYSAVDHFLYSTTSAAELGGDVQPSTRTGSSVTAAITFTPSDFGAETLYVAAVDAAGNQSATASFSIFVSA